MKMGYDNWKQQTPPENGMHFTLEVKLCDLYKDNQRKQLKQHGKPVRR